MTAGSSSSMRADLKGLAGNSFIYGLGSVLLKSISVLVLPLYTRYLTPADYGIVALGTTLSALLSLVLPLSLYSAVARFFFLAGSEQERRRMIGTIWLAMIGFALCIAAAMDLAGPWLFGAVFSKLPFDPYVRISIWTAFLGIFSYVPLNLFQVKEQPRAYVGWTGASLILTVGLTVVLVAFFEKGAYGYLLAALVSNALLAVPYIIVTLRDADLCVDRAHLKNVLKFSLPLVPHGLASWALSLSDRAILQIYVSLSALGLYSLGYQFGAIMIMISGAISTAWWPFVYKRMAEKGDAAKPELSRIITYYALTVCVVAIGLCLFARDAILLLTTESYHPAQAVVPVVVIGYLFNSLYFIPAQFLFVKSQTKWLPVATVAAGLVNIAMNFALIPHFGIMAAAWATFAAFAVMLVLTVLLAQRVFPFPYEYGRLGRLFAASSIVIAIGLTVNLPLPLDLPWKAALCLAFAPLLVLLGFVSAAEWALMGRFAAGIAMRLRRPVQR